MPESKPIKVWEATGMPVYTGLGQRTPGKDCVHTEQGSWTQSRASPAAQHLCCCGELLRALPSLLSVHTHSHHCRDARLALLCSSVPRGQERIVIQVRHLPSQDLARGSTCLYHLMFVTSSQNRNYQTLAFTDEDAEAQSGEDLSWLTYACPPSMDFIHLFSKYLLKVPLWTGQPKPRPPEGDVWVLGTLQFFFFFPPVCSPGWP
jgi:hypothetical protein